MVAKFARWLGAGAAALVMFAAQIPPNDAKSNLAGWLEILGVANVGQLIAAPAFDTWATGGAAAVLLIILAPWLWKLWRRRVISHSVLPSAKGSTTVVIQAPALPEEVPADFAKWGLHDDFQIWQAACLLAGIEPFERLAETQGTQAYPYYQLIIGAVRKHELSRSRIEAELKYSDISKEDLRQWCRQKGIRTPLFPETLPKPCSQPSEGKGEFVALTEYAVAAYEKTKDTIVGKAASHGKTEAEILTWYAWYLKDKCQIYGERPPSRIVEPVDLRGNIFVVSENGELIVREFYGNKRWINLRIKKADMESALSGLGKLSDELG